MTKAKQRKEASVRVRTAVGKDVGDIVAIERAASLTPLSRESLLRALGRSDVTGWVAEVEDGDDDARGAVVGWAMVVTAKEDFRVARVAVHPEWQRMGVAKAILGRAREKAARMRRPGFVAVDEHRDDLVAWLRGSGLMGFGLLRDQKDRIVESDAGHHFWDFIVKPVGKAPLLKETA